MARIRTIKPEFFTSEDIVCLSPLARLLYIALWCEADRDGRMAFKPRTFKMRYFPADDCNIQALCAELLAAGLVVLYGDGLAYIPQFDRHQHVNPREAKSELPAPPAHIATISSDSNPVPNVVNVQDVASLQQSDDNVSDSNHNLTRAPRVSTRENLDLHVQVGKERKGREGTRVSADASTSASALAHLPTPPNPPNQANPSNPPDSADPPGQQAPPESSPPPEPPALLPPPLPPPDAAPAKTTLAGAVCVALKSVGMAQVNPSHEGLRTLIADGAGLDMFVDAGRECVDRGKGFAYLLATVQGRLGDARRMAANATAAACQPLAGGLIAGAI